MRVGIVIYGLGLSSLLLCDLIISRFFDLHVVAEWALFRSLVGSVALIPLIGLDQVLVRSPENSTQLFRLLALQVPFLSVLVGACLAYWDVLPNVWMGTALAAGSAASLALFQFFRSHHRQALSQFAQQGWKIAVLLAVLLALSTGWVPNLILLGIVLLLVCDAVTVAFVMKAPPWKMRTQVEAPVSVHYAIGLRFMVTALLLSLSVYAEQLVVNRLGTVAESALYFTAATYFLFPMSFVNGYLAFQIGPWVRDRHDLFLSMLRSRWWQILLASSAYAVVMNVLGYALWHVVGPSVGAVDTGLQMLLLLTGIARTLYLLPSGYLGVFGRPRQHDVLIAFQLVCFAISIGTFIALQRLSFDLVHSVAAASAVNWVCRTLAGFIMTAVVANSRIEGQ